MFKTIKNAWAIPDLRRKILFTLLIIVIFRFGSCIPVPFLNVDALRALMAQVESSGTALSYINMLSGGAFANATLFAMGITPYINSSIIMQLLTVAIPLERMAKEGERGPQEDQYDHPLCNGYPGPDPRCRVLFLPEKLGGYGQRQGDQHHPVQRRFCADFLSFYHHPLLHGRNGADDVAGRADQPEGHWQRYFHSVVCRYCGASAGYIRPAGHLPGPGLRNAERLRPVLCSGSVVCPNLPRGYLGHCIHE